MHTVSIWDCPECRPTADDFAGSWPTNYNRKLYQHDIERAKELDPTYIPPYTFDELIKGAR